MCILARMSYVDRVEDKSMLVAEWSTLICRPVLERNMDEIAPETVKESRAFLF